MLGQVLKRDVVALTLSCLALCVVSGCSPAAPSDGLDSPPATVRRADDFVNSVGVNIHLSYFRTPYGLDWESVVKPKLLALGVRHVRDAGTVVSDDSWMATVYGRMRELSDRGVRFNLIMLPAQNVTDYTHLQQFDRLMSYAAPVVEAFEGLNEHDGSQRPNWVTEVRAFQRVLYTTVKHDSRTAGMPVYGPSMAHAGNASAVGDLSASMDFGAIHPYPGGGPPMTNVGDHERKVRVMTNSRPLVVTETGYHTAMSWNGPHPAVSEQAMGRYVPRMFLELFRSGIARSYLYEFIDQGSSTAEREQRFGLLRWDGADKPAYVALKNLIALLQDPGPAFSVGRLEYSLSGDASGVHQLVLQKRDGRFYLILWQDASSFDLERRADATVASKPLEVKLTAPAAQVRIFTPLTSATAQQQWQQAALLSVNVPDHPLVIEITP